jgi:cell shape-determining protein MreC
MIKLIIRIAYFLCVLIEGVIGLRIILYFINANSENQIVQWVNTISNILITPFQGIVDSTINFWKFEIPSVLIVSLFFYIVAGIVCSELLKSYRNND